MWNYRPAVLQGLSFPPALLRTNSDDLEPTFCMYSFLVVVDLMSGGKGPHGNKEFMADLFEIVQNKHDSLFDSVEEWSFDVLEFAELFLADKVTHEGVDLNSPVDPDLNIFVVGGEEVLGQVLDGDEVVEGQKYVQTAKTFSLII